MTSKREIVWIPKLEPDRLVHLSYNSKGSYAVRDFINPEKRGKDVFNDILPFIKWRKNATGIDFISVDDKEYWIDRLEELSNQVIKGKSKITEDIQNNNKTIKSSTIAKTIKHTKILCEVESTFNNLFPTSRVYLADHGKGSAGVHYRGAERKSKRAYYSLKMYNSWPPKRGYNVKDPDCIVIEGNRIKYVIEIKWGYLEDYPNEATDLNSIFEKKEFNEIYNAIKNARCCRVKGPYVSNGDEIPGKFLKDFKIDENFKYLVVSDLIGLWKNRKSDSSLIKEKYTKFKELFTICDIRKDIDIFYSLERFLKMN